MPAASDILLVEDDLFLRDELLSALQSKGFAVRWTASIQAGLSMAREQIPAMIVSDVRLPDGDGRDLLAAVRQDPDLKSVQFVLMTGYHREAPQRTGMNLGADDYLAKPFALADFITCVEARLERSRVWQQTMEQRAVDYLRDMTSLSLPHEFFTPLAAILGFSELLLDSPRCEGPEIWESLRHIRASAERLHRTLQNYIFILQIMDADVGNHPREALSDLKALCEDLEPTVAAAAERHSRTKDLVLHCELRDPEREVLVFGSELTKIADELVDNAFKFSGDGNPVEVTLNDDGSDLCLCVRDRGRGLSARQIQHIGAFRQFDRTRFEQQGLGLGLTIAQNLVERSEGRFSIESTDSEGTLVCVRWRILSREGRLPAER